MPETEGRSVAYTIGFAGAVCLVCAIVVSSAAVALRPLQERNQTVDRMRKVLEVAALADRDERLSSGEVAARFGEHVVPRVIELETGAYDESIASSNDDHRTAARDATQSRAVPENAARVRRVPHRMVVYHVTRGQRVDALVLPIHGFGLYSTMYGYIALRGDGSTIAGITFYDHGETPGLGGQIDSPRWQRSWAGRRAFGPDGGVAIEVIKGAAGPPSEDPYRVDGISGATITSRGVSAMLKFWLGPEGFGPYLRRVRDQAVEGRQP